MKMIGSMRVASMACSIVVLINWLVSTALAQSDKYFQSAPPDAFVDGSTVAYYGSENEWSRRQFEASKVQEQPNRLGQRLILAIQDGRPEQAVTWCNEYLAQDPQQLEALFALTVAQAQLGQVEEAFATMVRTIDGGLPFDRFVAGPRKLLEPLTSSNQFQTYLAAHPIHVVHGPLLGAMTDASVRIWVRTAEESDITVRVFLKQGDAIDTTPVATASGRTSKTMDFTGVVQVSGLQPATDYRYELFVDGQRVRADAHLSFRTFPHPHSPGKFRIGFGGCAAYIPENERMWDTITNFHPFALLMLGDNVYIDLAEEAGPLHRYTYYQRQSRPEFRRLTQTVPIFAIWDDHDAAIDDVWLGPYRDKPSWKPSMLQLQKENWNNPSYGDAEWPGCWFKFMLGDIEFFMLDCRYYRTNPFAVERTMLGPVQKAWLLSELKKSDAAFKVLASSVAWAEGAKPGSHDTWDGFPEEREEIFSFIEKNGITGIVLLSADRHRSDAWKIPRSDGRAFYDMMSSRLTNAHTHELIPGALFSYNEKCSFGLLTFDTSIADPQVTYEIISIDGEHVHSLKLNKSQISHSAKVAGR